MYRFGLLSSGELIRMPNRTGRSSSAAHALPRARSDYVGGNQSLSHTMDVTRGIRFQYLRRCPRHRDSYAALPVRCRLSHELLPQPFAEHSG